MEHDALSPQTKAMLRVIVETGIVALAFACGAIAYELAWGLFTDDDVVRALQTGAAAAALAFAVVVGVRVLPARRGRREGARHGDGADD